jgi:Asp-tRNA(Asn)/Glu-tRNA(Gln) amidotransferase A subunit family amidase
MSKNIIAASLLILMALSCGKKTKEDISLSEIAAAERIAGLTFTEAERDSMQGALIRRLEAYEEMRKFQVSNDVPPALVFNPLPTGFQYETGSPEITWPLPEQVRLPEDPNELAFLTVAELSVLVRQQQVSSVELTGLFLSRLKAFGDTLLCIVTLTEELAMEQARRADREIAEGLYRGPLHGIPYGIKDLFSYPDHPTSWGAMPYKDQVISEKAEVIRRLEEAGAVMLAKLTLGALAMGDVWYGGTTRNPWNLEQGSSGSSAGSASATAAGMLPFTIGTETWGSIVSPSTRCGVTGLRPTFGRVSRHGAMALSWSMDKIGPICRSALDCGLVFQAIHGKDEKDPSTMDAAFGYEALEDLSGLRFACIENIFDTSQWNRAHDSISLEVFRRLGCRPDTIRLPADIPAGALSIILNAEAAAAFDDLTRSGKDDMLVRQDKGAWPNYFRGSRFVPAVEYIRANRIRTLMIRELHELFSRYDVIITPSFGGDQMLMTNLSGHPCLVMPNGFNEEGSPTSICLLGNYFQEGKLLEAARHYQMATEFDDQHPKMFR